jgi:hypothetical protein
MTRAGAAAAGGTAAGRRRPARTAAVRRVPAVRRRLATGAVSAVLLAAALTACSQVSALAPVGGNHLTEVRFATIDVLTGAATDVLTAPVCASAADRTVTCTGETVDNQTITAVSPAADQTTFTVLVGSTQLFSGSIMAVLNGAARATP